MDPVGSASDSTAVQTDGLQQGPHQRCDVQRTEEDSTLACRQGPLG